MTDFCLAMLRHSSIIKLSVKAINELSIKLAGIDCDLNIISTFPDVALKRGEYHYMALGEIAFENSQTPITKRRGAKSVM